MFKVTYPAVLDDSENKKGFYTVTFPDVEGAVAEGGSRNAAIFKASQVLETFLEDIPKDQLPASSKIDYVKAAHPDKMVVPIYIDLREKAPVLSLPDAFNEKHLKFTQKQVNDALYSFGHITKEEKDYLDKQDSTKSKEQNGVG